MSVVQRLDNRSPVMPSGQERSTYRILKIGLSFGAIGVYLAIIGLLAAMQKRWVIVDLLGLGYLVMAMLAGTAGASTAGAAQSDDARSASLALAQGAAAGLLAGMCMAALAVVARFGDLRSIFIALSPDLVRTLSLGLPFWSGIALLPLIGALCGLAGGLLRRSPDRIRLPILVGIGTAIAAGIFQDLVKPIVSPLATALGAPSAIYDWKGMELPGAVLFFILGLLGTVIVNNVSGPSVEQVEQLAPATRKRLRLFGWGLCILGLLAFPAAAGPYVAQVFMLVGLYILMGLGLNLEMGVAGLLDLGFVAFFAIGAYSTALLTATDPHSLAALWGIPSLSYWAAMPIAVLLSVLVGMAFGIPVLGIRGDYLAVATLGMGEIVRVIVLSDLAAPLLNGAGGILGVPRPSIGGTALNSPLSMFYLTVFFSIIAAYCAWRMQHSRLGRAWTALKDDEDVARGLGINTVATKLLAYGFGAAFAGLAGSILATMLGSVFPSSFTLLVSINVLVLIVVGGLGSIMGVVVGAFALIGLPELLKEFGEYRFLLYGATLTLVMIKYPQGIWPASAAVRGRSQNDNAAKQARTKPSTTGASNVSVSKVSRRA